VIKLEDIFEAYYECRKNKRNTENAIQFELNYDTNCIKIWDDINKHLYKPSKSIAFIVTKPKRREIFAASFRDRIIHHYIDIRLRPLIENVLIDTTCNNRKGKGTAACVEYLKHDILEVSNNYTSDCWVSKMDMKGFFMSIRKDILDKKIHDFIDENYVGEDKEELKWLTCIIVNDHPEKNCILKSLWSEWKGLDKDKSLFGVGDTRGIPIGNLISQLLANFYLNDFDHYVKETLGFNHYGRYVDDFYIVDSDKTKILNAIPLIRKKLSEVGVTLHPNKFYLQYYTKGIELVGSVIKPNRLYVHNRTVNNAFQAIKKFNDIVNIEDYAEEFATVINSYLGFMKNCDSYAIRRNLMKQIDSKWWKVLYIEDHFYKVSVKKKYKSREKMKNKLKNNYLKNKRIRNNKFI
jgi:hypothetical protein